jgi:hypothetical protein
MFTKAYVGRKRWGEAPPTLLPGAAAKQAEEKLGSLKGTAFGPYITAV